MCNIKSGDDTLLPSVSDAEEVEGDDMDTESDSDMFLSDSGDSEEENESGDDDESVHNSGISDTGGDTVDVEEEENEAFQHFEETELVETFKRVRMEGRRQVPPVIDCEDLTVDISFHPNANVLAAATINGDIVLYKYNLDAVTVCDQLEVHTKACRAVEYSKNGDLLFSASKDRSIMISDSRTGKLKEFYDKAHDGALYSLTVISESTFATGDEDGVIKLWDVRHRDPIFSLTGKVKDYISSMITTDKKRHLACTSGEGTLTTINLTSRKFHVQSEVFESEYTCASLCKEDQKLIVGTDKGKMVIYNWGEFGLHTDVFPGPVKKVINCQVAISNNIVITGWEDGVIRASYLFPNTPLGIVGQHALSVDGMDLSHDGEYIATCSLDQKIRFWRISYFNELDFSSINKRQESHLPSSLYTDRKNFFAELE